MLRRLNKKIPSPLIYDWSDVRCSCGSPNIIRLETKEPCNNSKCKSNPEHCELSNCEKSIYFGNRKTVEQRFICRVCGNRFTEIRRTI